MIYYFFFADLHQAGDTRATIARPTQCGSVVCALDAAASAVSVLRDFAFRFDFD